MTDQTTEMGFGSRLINVFFAPAKVFNYLKDNPKWLGPFLIVLIVLVASQALVIYSDAGDKIMIQAIKQSSPNLTDEQARQGLEIGKPMAVVGPLVAYPIFFFLIAGFAYLIFNVIMGGLATFKQLVSVYAHAGIIGIGSIIIRSVLAYVKQTSQVTTSLASFFPNLELESYAYKLLSYFDLFTIWAYFVFAIGVGILYKWTTGKATTIIFSVFIAIGIIYSLVSFYVF